MKSNPFRQIALLALLLICPALFAAETFRVAAYNVENYLDEVTQSRARVKSPEAKAKIRETIKAMNPDVIAFEEMGTTNALLELRDSLKADGLDFPHWEHITAHDTNIHVAVLSKFPFIERRPHTNELFLLAGKRFGVKRGFVEVDIRVSSNHTFTLFAAHLKSKLASPQADEEEQRLEEAKILREKIDDRLKLDPNANIVVLGDLNDTPDSKPIKQVLGTGKAKLVDTRPAERNGDNLPNPTNPNWAPRNIAWTHYFGKEDSYSRIDYILLSPAMAKHWVKAETYIPVIPNWGIGSDHRPVLATFTAENK